MSETLEHDFSKFAGEIRRLRVNKRKDRARPHKFIMLLAVAHLFKSNYLVENKVCFDDVLKAEFARLFDQYATEHDSCQPTQPFFHLRSADFWHHRIVSGKETSYSYLTTSGGGEKRIREHIEYAYLSYYAYNVFNDCEACSKVIKLLEEKLKGNHVAS